MRAVSAAIFIAIAAVCAVAVNSTAECAICEFLVKEIEAQLAKNKTETEIIADLDKVCSHLGAIKAECTAVVNQYAPQLIQLLLNKEDPQTVCHQVGLCKNATKIVEEKVDASAECAICEFLVKEIEAELAKNSTEAAIMKKLDAVCSHLGAIKAECTAVVNQYGPQIIALLEQKEDPQTVCTQVKACKTAARKVAPVAATAECAICEFLIKEVEARLASNKTETEIEADLDKVCGHLGAIKAECTAVVNQYLPQMIQALENKEDPQTVCTQVKACKTARSLGQALRRPIVSVN